MSNNLENSIPNHIKKIIDGAVTVIPSSAQLRQETIKCYIMYFSIHFLPNFGIFQQHFDKKYYLKGT